MNIDNIINIIGFMQTWELCQKTFFGLRLNDFYIHL